MNKVIRRVMKEIMNKISRSIMNRISKSITNRIIRKVVDKTSRRIMMNKMRRIMMNKMRRIMNGENSRGRRIVEVVFFFPRNFILGEFFPPCLCRRQTGKNFYFEGGLIWPEDMPAYAEGRQAYVAYGGSP